MTTTFCRPNGGIVRAFIASCLFLSVLHADLIVLKDGDRVTGEIVKKDGAKLTVKSKNFGLITINWADVESVRADKPLTVVLEGDRTAKATLETENGKIVVGEPPTQTVDPTQIVALRNEAEQRAYERYLKPRLLDLWVMTGSINVAGARGNAGTSTLTTPINFVRASRTSRTTAYFNSIRSAALVDGVSTQTAKAVRGGWAFSRNFTNRVFFNFFNDYEYDKFQFLDLRAVLGGGLGYQVWKAENGRFDLTGGTSWNRESFSPLNADAFTRNAGELYWGDDFSMKLNSRISIVQKFRTFHNALDSGVFRVNFDAGATVNLTKWLIWNSSVTDRYLSNPVPGRKKNDLLYSTGLGFTFSR